MFKVNQIILRYDIIFILGQDNIYSFLFTKIEYYYYFLSLFLIYIFQLFIHIIYKSIFIAKNDIFYLNIFLIPIICLFCVSNFYNYNYINTLNFVFKLHINLLLFFVYNKSVTSLIYTVCNMF